MKMTVNEGALLREVARLVLSAQRAELSCQASASSTQCFIIGELGRNGPMSLKQLGERLTLDKSWISRAVDSMQKDGLVLKVASQEDKRKVEISLSKDGQLKFQRINAILDSHASGLMNKLDADEQQRVASALVTLKHLLEGVGQAKGGAA